MNTYTIISIENAIQTFSKYSNEIGWYFRGHRDSEWELIPSAGRDPYKDRESSEAIELLQIPEYVEDKDLGMFNRWRELSEGYRENLPENDFKCLAAAQHYGLPTRLLDITENFLVALYFACEGSFDNDGAVYAHFPVAYIDVKHALMKEIDQNAALVVAPFDERILQQRGAFIYFPDPTEPLKAKPIDGKYKEMVERFEIDDSDLVKFVIPRHAKFVIHRKLRDIGISRRSLFPDLDGLSRDFTVEAEYKFEFQKELKRANKTSLTTPDAARPPS